MNEADYGLIKLRQHESSGAAQARRVDGADLYAENLRYDFLHSRNRVDQNNAMGLRLAQESGSGRARALNS